jgi:hypothetical protein
MTRVKKHSASQVIAGVMCTVIAVPNLFSANACLIIMEIQIRSDMKGKRLEHWWSVSVDACITDLLSAGGIVYM